MDACNDCECGKLMKNSNFGCVPTIEVTHKLIFQSTFDSAGNRNRVLLTDVLNQAYFDAMINHADPTKRWYPTPAFKNINDVRGENKSFEFDDQTTEFLAEGARRFEGMIPGISGSGANSAQMKSIIESVRCGDYSVYAVTVKNQLAGNLSSDGLGIEGVEIDEQSISAMFVKKTNTTPQHLLTSFNWSQITGDDRLRVIDCGEVGGANLMALRGLFEVCYDLLEITTTTLKLRLRTLFGTEKNPITVDGLVAADFVSSDSGATSKIFNETDNADVSITGVTENPDGTYELTFAAQDAGDILIPFAKKTGYDFTCMKDSPVDVSS